MSGVGDVLGAAAALDQLVKRAQELGAKAFAEYHHFWKAFEKQLKNDRNVPWREIANKCHLQPEFIVLATAVIHGEPKSREEIEKYLKAFVKPPNEAYEDLDTILHKILDAVDIAAIRAIEKDPPAVQLAQRRNIEDTIRQFGERTLDAVERIERRQAVDDASITRHWATAVVERHDGIYYDEWLHLGPAPSPLKRDWDRFISDTPWHELVKAELLELQDLAQQLQERNDGALAELAARCAGIDCSGEYRSIAGALLRLERIAAPIAREVNQRQLEQRLQSLQDVLRKLVSRGREPRFDRCLLVAGSAGEGKTHFIAELMRDAADAPDTMVMLLLRAVPSSGRLDGALRDEAELVTGFPWEHWEDLARHLAQHDRQLVVAVDDFDRWPGREVDAVADLEEAIARSTRLGSVYWLLTAEVSGLERLIGSRTPWRRYGWAPESEGSRERSPLRVDGWLMLDDLNRAAQTGIGILASAQPRRVPPVIAQLAAANEPEVAAVLAQLSTPLTAWTVAEAAGERDIDYHTLVDLSHEALVEAVWERLLDRFRGTRDCDRRQFRSVMALAAEAVAEARTDTLRLGSLRSSIATKGRADDATIIEPRVADSGLRHAMALGLLTLLPAADEPEADSSVRLRFELVWEWLIASSLLRGARTSDGRDVDVAKLLDRVAELAPERILENVAQLCLVRIDSAQGAAAAHREGSVWDAVLRSEGVPDAAVWFGGAKAGHRTRAVLVSRAAKHARRAGRRTTFATLWFLAEAGGAMAMPSDALRPVAERYELIRDHELAGLLEFVVARLLDAVPDRRELDACLAQLLGSEVTGADTMTLAQTAVAAIGRLGVSPVAAIIASRELLRKADPRATTGPLETFHDCYIHAFLRQLIDRHGVPAYGMLRDPRCRWYEAETRVHDAVAHRMRTEANTAFGHWYRRNPKGRGDYVQLVATLTNAGEERDRRNAFFLIRHTRPIFKGGSERVDPGFRPYIRTLRDDPDLADLVSRYRRFFDENLDQG